MLLKVYKSRVWLLLFMLMPFIGNAQISGLPTGWEFTLNPTSATYAIPTDVAFNGIDALTAGDWVGAFYMDNGVMECGGAVEWDGTIPVAIAVFGNDTLEAPDKNGFSEGEAINWMVYRGVENECVKAYDAAAAEFNWASGALGAVASFGACEICLDKTLSPGFQYISSNVVPSNLNFQAVMTDVLDNLAFARNSSGAQLIKFGPVWVNQIGNWVVTQGYQVRMNNADVLTICGDAVDPQTPIDLLAGFKYISFLPQTPINAQVALGSILDNLQFARNSAGAQLIKFGPVWVNQIGNMNPGEGYQIRMNNADQLIYPVADGASAPSGNNAIQVSGNRTGHFIFEGGDPSILWSIFLNSVQVGGVDAVAGDELAIYDGDKMVGQWTLTDVIVPGTFMQSLLAYKTLLSGPGYGPGNDFTIKFWDESEGMEVTDFTYEFIDPYGQGLYMGDVFPLEDNVFTLANLSFTLPIVEWNVTTASNPLEGGTTAGDGMYEDGSDATVTAAANEGWMFINWTVDGTEVSTDAEYTFTVTADVALVANFEVLGGPAPVLVSAEPGQNSVNLTWEAIPEPLSASAAKAGSNVSSSRTGHFVFEGGDPSILWSMFLNSVQIGGVDAVAGDELAIYDGVKMVGQWTLTDVIVPGTFMQSLLAYKTLLSGPGYGPGNDFTIKFWDESEGMEVTDFTYEFIDPYGQGLYMGDVFPLEDNVFTLANLNFTSVVPYVPSFNIYQDDMLIAEGVDGTTFMVDGLDNGTEYCFYVTQNMEDLSESDASNVLCATPFSECEDVVINLWPVAPADVCFGTPVDIDFSGVEILNAASYLYSVDPDEAGSFDGDFFLLDDMYVGVVTITLNAYATPPCMDASASLSFEVYPLPVFDCPAYGPFCEGDENIMFMEDGDFFYGGNLIDGWNPSVVGTFTITYVYTDPDTGCSDECMFDIVVNPAPVAECPEYAPICVGFGFEFPIVENWVYTNSVGETVIGIDADVPGNFEFTLTVTNEFDCSASCPFEILVNPAPVVECPDDIVVCVLEDFELTGATPEGGTYSGDGVENGWFFTIVAGLGDHTITYTYMDDVTGCENFCTFIVTVNDLPAPVCPPGFEVCVNGDPVDLEGASPEGGTYGGVGVYEGVFYPDSAGVGYHELYYSYTDPETLCTGFCVIGVDVYPLPEVTCPEDMVYLLDELPVTLEGAEPIGGTYSGEGVEEGVFFVEEEGFYEITYTYTDIETGCTNSCMFIITVNDEPPVCEDAVINFFPEFQEDVCAGTELVIDFSGVEILNAINVMWSVDPEDAGEYDGTDFVLNTDYVGEVTLALFAEAQAPCANAEASLTFMVNPLPYIEVELSATEVCLGESVTATVNGPADGAYPYLVSYTINDMPFEIEMPEAFGELELLEMTPGTYEGVLVSIVDNKGCMAMPNEVFTVVVYSLPTIEVELSATEVCLGESVTATVNGPVDGAYPYLVTYTIDGTPYEIEMLEAFGELELLEMTPGTYEGVLVSIVDNNGCMSMPNEVFTVVVNPLPEFDCPVYGPFCLGDEEEMFEETGDFYFDGAQIFGWTPDMADTFTITYVYTDLVTGCSDECTFDIVVNELPYLELSLSASEICLGETVNGSITGPEDGEYPYVVEYSINGVPMTDQILSPVTVLPLTPDMAGVYTLEVLSVVDNNGCIAMEVAGVELIVLPLTEITLQPVSLEVEFSMPAEFSVEADNATGYQWYHNDMMIADATDATYSIASAMPEDAGTYYCVVMGDCDDVTSEVVTLAVLPWTQTIDLLGAINGFSTYLDVIEDDVATIFNPIVANVQVVDFVSPFFTWVPNGLDYTLNEEKGALVQLSGGYPTSIDVMGYPTLGNSLDLPGGVTNYLPVWSQNVVLADDVFGPISDDIYAVFSQDYSGYWFPMYNLYTLEYLVPGSSYIVLLNNDATVSFDVPAVDAAPGYADIPGNVTTWNDVTLTASQHNIVITADAMSQLEVDDVIGAFNEYGQITGMVEINSLRDNTMLRTYGDNPFTQRNEGFVDGDIMTIKVWRNGEEMIADATFDANMPNDNVFAKNGISTITNLKLGITSINDLTSGLTASLYPNPATDVVNVSTNFEIKNLKVVNYVGQVVFDQNVEQMNFQINTSNYVSGMYFVQIETNDGAVITKRLTVK